MDMLKLYRNAYKFILKTDFMLLVIALVSIFFTAFIWVGVPVFVMSDWLSKFNIPIYVIIFIVPIIMGFILSLYFIPLNLKVARRVAKIKGQSDLSQLIWIQLAFVLLFAVSIVLVCVGLIVS